MQFAHFRFDPEADRLGEGPLSEVYRAVDERLGRTVALKILRAHAEIDPEADTRFLNEAKHASNLVHPNIATVYEYGRDQNTSYIAMEYLKGRTLDKILQTRTLGYEECLRIGLQVTAALAVVHHAGLIHRDLKPGNIMVQDDGNVKLLDFGIARATDEAGITQHGVMVGTVLYMSPEQVRGEDLDFRSDIFALGSVLYQVMTNALPFPGRSFPEVCMAILDGTVKPPSTVRQGLPQAFEDFVMKCLRPDPDDRYQTTDEAQHALMAVAEILKVTHGTNLANRIQGKLLILPFECTAGASGSCHVLAGGLRKDIASELDRVKGLDVELFDGDPIKEGENFEWVLRGLFELQGGGGALDFALEHFNEQGQIHNSFREVIRHQEDDEWALQADLTRSTVRVVRKQLADARGVVPYHRKEVRV
ncbi:MAG: serine/threonine-protein kinase, partial [Planctomycetota bacterium]